MTSKTSVQYVPCSEKDIPAGVRWYAPRGNQGQIVTESYGGFGAGPFWSGDPYLCRYDAHDQTTEYYRLAE